MLATQAPAKRTFCSVADNSSNVVDFDTFDFNFGVFQNIPLLYCHNTQKRDISAISPRHKRARPSQPHHFAEDYSRSSAPTIDVQRRLNPAASASFTSPCASIRLAPGRLIQGETNEGGFGDDRIDSLLPNVPISFPDEGMPRSKSAARNLNLSSNAGKNKLPDSLILEGSRSTRLSVPRSNNDIPVVSSRRRPVPGENPPLLASSWRTTTSSRGSDNPLSARGQAKANDVTASTSDVSGRDVATDGRDFGTGYDNMSCDLSSARGFDIIEEHQSLYFKQYLPGSDAETFDDIAELTPCNAPSGFEAGPDPSTISVDPFPTSRPEMTNNSISWPLLQYPWQLSNTESTLVPYESISNTSALMSTSFNHSSEDYGPSMNNGILNAGTAHPNFEWSSNFYNLLEPLGFGSCNFSRTTNAEESFGFTEHFTCAAQANTCTDTVNALMPQESTNLDILSSQSSFALQENNDHSSVGFPHEDIRDLHDNHVQLFDTDSLLAPPEDWSSSGPTKLFDLSQTGNFTRWLPRFRSQDRIRQSKKQYKHTTGEILPYGNFGSPSLSLGSSEFSTESPTFLSMHGHLVTSIDVHSNDGVRATTEFEEVASCSGESEENNLSEPSGRSTTPRDLDRRMQMLQDSSANKKPQSGSHISAKFSNLKDSANNHSPVLVLIEDTNDTQQEVQDILAKANQQSRSQKTRSSSNSPSRKIATTWEHTFVVQNEFIEAASESPPERASRKLAGRKGPLGDVSKKRALEMRKIGSCLRCRISKIKCTPDEICQPCLKAASSPFTGRVCTRTHLRDYVNLFLPEQAVRPFQKESIDRLKAEKVSGFSDNQFEVYVSSGPNYTPIQLIVHTFRTPDQSFLVFKKIVTNDVSKVSTFTKAYSPPLGIFDSNQDLSGKLTNHIREIIEGERNYGEVLYGNTSQLTWDVYEAVRLYQRANPTNQFLRNMLMLHAMQFFMTKSVTLLRDSFEDVLNSLPRPTEFEYSYNPNLRLVSIQMKHMMCFLIRETYLDVLEELEKELRLKEPTLWAPTFCCIMILCMCAEMVQTTTDLRVVNALDDKAKSTSGLDKNGNSPSRDGSIDVCRKLDDLPIASATSIFHLIYRTNKLRDGSKREESFNPIRDGLDTVREAQLGQDVEEFVRRIHVVVSNHQNELKYRAATPSFNSSSDVIGDHAIFRKRNSGRLVAGFLQSTL